MKILTTKLMFTLSLLSLASCSSYQGSRDIASEKPLYASAEYYYESESDRMTQFVQEIHKDWDMFIAKYNDYNETYVGAYNKHKLKVRSKVKVYSDLSFRKKGNAYTVSYSPYASNSAMIIDLDPKYNQTIEQLFTDLQREAHFVTIDGVPSAGRSGAHLSAKDLPLANEITLKCKNVIYVSDNSGGNRCEISARNLDIKGSDTKIFVDVGGNQNQIDKKELRTWNKNY